MEQINNQLIRLAERLQMTSSKEEPEEYILTAEEEERVLYHALKRAKEHVAWKMAQILKTKEEIDQKISEINWDERIDKEALLQRANMNKHYGIWIKEQRIKSAEEEIRKQKELKELWTAKRMYQLMAWSSKNAYGKDLIVNDDNKKLITIICFFLSRDERFETELGFSLKKGLCIRGAAGLGKTYLLKCVEKNELNPILILSMLEIVDDIRTSGEFQINMGDNKIIYLDDVGTEENIIKYYGTQINFFKNFIEGIYLRSKSFNNLIFSTNNSFSEMEEKYGFRVRSRMKDMFNIIDVTGKDMRG